MLVSSVEPPVGVLAEPRRRRPGVAVAWLAAVVVLAAVTALLVAVAAPWPEVGALARENPPTTAFIERHRAQERRAGRSGRVAWTWVPYGAISPDLRVAVLVAEDIEFFSHHGFSAREARQALRQAWEERRFPRGASTVTQQLAKNLWLSPSRHPLRKAREAVLTWRLERALGKRRILELYLNVAEFGPGVYGAEAAARHHFGKPASALTEREAAQLAAVLPRPRRWRPDSDSPAYQRRVASIERRMARAVWLWRVI
jgi:monofunctional biosynthetic peptidoglycan transglycosylase